MRNGKKIHVCRLVQLKGVKQIRVKVKKIRRNLSANRDKGYIILINFVWRYFYTVANIKLPSA